MIIEYMIFFLLKQRSEKFECKHDRMHHVVVNLIAFSVVSTENAAYLLQ